MVPVHNHPESFHPSSFGLRHKLDVRKKSQIRRVFIKNIFVRSLAKNFLKKPWGEFCFDELRPSESRRDQCFNRSYMSITSGRRDIGSGSKCREYPCTAGKYKKGVKKMEKFLDETLGGKSVYY